MSRRVTDQRLRITWHGQDDVISFVCVGFNAQSLRWHAPCRTAVIIFRLHCLHKLCKFVQILLFPFFYYNNCFKLLETHDYLVDWKWEVIIISINTFSFASSSSCFSSSHSVTPFSSSSSQGSSPAYFFVFLSYWSCLFICFSSSPSWAVVSFFHSFSSYYTFPVSS